MVKNAISDYSSTAASNTDVGGINIDEGMAPSNVNNAIREVMSHLADLNAGTSSLGTIKVDNLQLDGNAITSTDTNGNITLTPNGTGSVVIDGINYPQADGTANYFLKTDGAGQLSFAQVGSASIVDNSIGATQLNVSGNGISGQVLASDADGSFSWADAPSAFSYNAVSGTTPSLDVGSYNFFNQGSLTGNTTVSFASVPTEAKWTYTFQTSGASANYDLTKVQFTGEKARLTSNTTTTTSGSAALASCLTISPDGLNVYILEESGDDIKHYVLKSPYQLSTIKFVSGLDISSKETDTTGIALSSDGTQIYIAGTSSDSVHSWTMSTAYDLSTASFNNSFVHSGTLTNSHGMDFNSDGTKIFLISQSGIVYRFSLSTAWDISTMSYDSQSLDVASAVSYGQSAERGLRLSSDGTKMIVNYQSEHTARFDMSTAYDLTTASLVQESEWYSYHYPMAQSDAKIGRAWHMTADGTKMFLLGYDEDTLNGFEFIDAYELTLPSSVQNSPHALFPNQTVTYTFFTSDGGTNVYLIDQQQSWRK